MYSFSTDAYKDKSNFKSGYNVSTHGGKKTDIDALEWAIEGEKMEQVKFC